MILRFLSTLSDAFMNGDAKTHQVKLKLVNGYGLYDMTGNVWEWCWDWHEDSTPTGGQDPVGAASGSNRVLRGGSWKYRASDVGRSARGRDAPDNLDVDMGMRLVARP